MPTTDRCPVPDCPNMRNGDKMLCLTCWRRVTRPTQSAVYKAWRDYSRAANRGSDDFASKREAYYAIREQAIREAEA
jgi:hypothetical protein